MSHNQFEKISMSSEYKENFIQKQIDQLENNIDNLDRWDTDDKVSIKSLERQ
jgi:hypothetical protein